MGRLSDDEFKKLQKHWYDRLKASGFHDIEQVYQGELRLIDESPDTRYSIPCFRSEYYRIIYQKVQDETTVFKNAADRHILTRYAEGIPIKQIVLELSAMQFPRNRHSVRFIIRKYEMRWGIRKYSRRELNLPKKKL